MNGYELSWEGPSHLTIYTPWFSVGVAPHIEYRGWYFDSYRGSDSLIRVVNLGGLLRLAWWTR